MVRQRYFTKFKLPLLFKDLIILPGLNIYEQCLIILLLTLITPLLIKSLLSFNELHKPDLNNKTSNLHSKYSSNVKL